MNEIANDADAGREPGEIESLLPFHAAGVLSARDTLRVDDALARDVALARQYKVIQDEYAETIALNESLGAPSARAMQKLFAAIDVEPARSKGSFNPLQRISAFLSNLSTRTLAWSAIAGAVAILLQAGVIGVVLKNRGPIQTASYQAQGNGSAALVRFAPDANISDIGQLLIAYNAKIVSGPNAGMFRIQFGEKPLSKQDAAQLLTKLQGEKIVSLAVPAE